MIVQELGFLKEKKSYKLVRVLVLLSAIAMIIGLWQLARTPLPWIDEILWVSSAKSLAGTGIGTPSVLQQFPRTGRFDIFYGPVPFWLGVLSFRCFGLSVWSWRILSWLFGMLLVIFSGAITFRLSKNRIYAALSATLVAFAPTIGARLSSGRMDTLTVCLELAGTLIVLGSPSKWSGVFAGFVLAGAALSTPRAMPFLAAFAVAAILSAILSRNFDSLPARMTSLLVCGCLVSGWTFSVGLTPISWFRFILHASAGDAGNVSPLLGGAWNQSGSVAPHELLLCLSMLFCAMLILAGRKKLVLSENFGFAALLVIGNCALSVFLISRMFDYQIFWLIPAIPVVLAAVSLLDPKSGNTSKILQTVLAFTLLFTIGVRAVKVGEVFRSWKSRDPEAMASFVCSNVPRHSTVYGPTGLYFYSVEGCGSTYLFSEEWTTEGLSSRQDPWFKRNSYLIWPTNTPTPAQVSVKEIARFSAERKNLILGSPNNSVTALVARVTGGYPETVLYKIQ